MEFSMSRGQEVLAGDAEFDSLANAPSQARIEPIVTGGGAVSAIQQLPDVIEGAIPIQMTSHVQQRMNLKIDVWASHTRWRRRLDPDWRGRRPRASE
jgi:hypothetical protein